MKTFVLAAVLLSPAALSAQVLIPSHAFAPEAVTFASRPEAGENGLRFVLKRGPAQPPSVDYKLRVVRPSREFNFRMPIGRPDSRYDYKILTPREDSEARDRPRRAPKR
jgi:hypothetical protein